MTYTIQEWSISAGRGLHTGCKTPVRHCGYLFSCSQPTHQPLTHSNTRRTKLNVFCIAPQNGVMLVFQWVIMNITWMHRTNMRGMACKHTARAPCKQRHTDYIPTWLFSHEFVKRMLLIQQISLGWIMAGSCQFTILAQKFCQSWKKVHQQPHPQWTSSILFKTVLTDSNETLKRWHESDTSNSCDAQQPVSQLCPLQKVRDPSNNVCTHT